MEDSGKIDAYIKSLPQWQQQICNKARELIHAADPNIVEEIKIYQSPLPYTQGECLCLTGGQTARYVFIYDPTVPDPRNVINQGHNNKTARSVQIEENTFPDEESFIELIKCVVERNEKGGWRKLSKLS